MAWKAVLFDMDGVLIDSEEYMAKTGVRALKKYGINYSRFIYGLKKSGIEMNRKALSELAIADPEAFKVLVETAKKAL